MPDDPSSKSQVTSTVVPMVIVGVLFFIFGFVTWLNGPLITFVKVVFHLDNISAFLIPVAFYVSYFVMALPSAAILRCTGIKKGMALGLFVMALGALLFGQYIEWQNYHGDLVGLFVMGIGLALLQTASNPYISILGPIDSAAQRAAIMGICNKVAGAVAPVVFGALVLKGIDALVKQIRAAPDAAEAATLINQFATRVYVPYLVMAALLAALAIWVLRSGLPEIKPNEANSEVSIHHHGRSLFSFPHLWLGVLCLFLYVGVEVMAGDAIGTYASAFGLPTSLSAHLTTATMAAMVIGYVTGLCLIPRFISQQRYLAVSAALGIVLALCAYLTQGYTSVIFVAALGFANAMMWRAIFPLAIKGLARHTEFASALLIMAIIGGALIPELFVHLQQKMNFQLAFCVVVVPCYLYILYYGLCGHKTGIP